MLFKLVGLKYLSAEQPAFQGEYISNFSFADSGDVLTDREGNPITFGIIAVPYGAEPPDASVEVGETKFWFNLFTNSIWSKTRKADLTIVKADLGAGGIDGSDYMLKSDYDSTDDGIVNAADMLSNGAEHATFDEVRNHLDDEDIHAPLSDVVIDPTYVWSSFKINAELNDKSDADHVHQPFDGVHTEGAPSYGAVPIPSEQNENFVLHTDGSWGPLSIISYLDNLYDTDIVYPEDGDMLIRDGDLWINAQIRTDSNLEAVFDPGNRTLTLNYIGGAPVWGVITGTLSDQTDLQNALDGKEAFGTTATHAALIGSAAHELGTVSTLTVAAARQHLRAVDVATAAAFSDLTDNDTVFIDSLATLYRFDSSSIIYSDGLMTITVTSGGRLIALAGTYFENGCNYACNDFIGGAAGALDALASASITPGQIALFVSNGKRFIYRLTNLVDPYSERADVTWNYYWFIAPDDAAGETANYRWTLCEGRDYANGNEIIPLYHKWTETDKDNTPQIPLLYSNAGIIYRVRNQAAGTDLLPWYTQEGVNGASFNMFNLIMNQSYGIVTIGASSGTPATQYTALSGNRVIQAQSASTLSDTIGRWSALRAINDFNRTAPSSSTITMVTNQTTWIYPGMAVRYINDGVVCYGIVKGITDTLLTIDGVPLNTGVNKIGAMHIGSRHIVKQIVLPHIPGVWGDAADTDLLLNHANTKHKWTLAQYAIVRAHFVTKAKDSGANQPQVNLTRAANAIMSSAIAIDTAWQDSGITIIQAQQVISAGDALEVTTDDNGSNKDAADLDVIIDVVELA